jgi:hypothetical protein
LPSTIQKGLKKAMISAGVTASGPTHGLDAGYGILTVQAILEHSDVRTTRIYTHVLNRGVSVRSPLGLAGSPLIPAGAEFFPHDVDPAAPHP